MESLSKWNLNVTTNIFTYHRAILQFMQILNMTYEIIITIKILYLFTPCFAQLTKLFFLFKSSKSSST